MTEQIATAIVYLGENGHPDVMNYTPRRTMNLYELAMMQKRREWGLQFHLMAVAARGDEKAVEALLRDLELD